MSTPFRAKVKLTSVERNEYYDKWSFTAVAASSYPEDGSDENNTYAKYTPEATFSLTVTNTSLKGKLNPGELYYVDFTPVPEKV